MVGPGWLALGRPVCVAMAGTVWLSMHGCPDRMVCWPWLAGTDWHWLDLAGPGWPNLAVAGPGWTCLAVHDYHWLELAAHNYPWLANTGYDRI